MGWGLLSWDLSSERTVSRCRARGQSFGFTLLRVEHPPGTSDAVMACRPLVIILPLVGVYWSRRQRGLALLRKSWVLISPLVASWEGRGSPQANRRSASTMTATDRPPTRHAHYPRPPT